MNQVLTPTLFYVFTPKKWKNGLPTLPQNLAWKTQGLKYLRVFLSNKAMVDKNWGGVED